MPDNIPDDVSTSTPVTGSTLTKPTRGTSKLALLASFVAGAFAAWILIEVSDQEAEVAAPPTSIQR